MTGFDLPLRIRLVKPPAGVLFALQRKRDELVTATRSKGEDLTFDLSITIKGDPDSTEPKLSGPFVQGPAAARFVYVNSGKRAGDVDTYWDRRAKISLMDLTWPLILKAQKTQSLLEASVLGASRDGGPACASVPLLDGGWRLKSASK